MNRALHREIGSYFTCNILTSILSKRCFYVTTLCAFMITISIGLSALVVEQLCNIAQNLVRILPNVQKSSFTDACHVVPWQTTNEKINRARYSYLFDEDGKPCNA